MSETALILLAAGSSTRMGSPKQLLDFHGSPLIVHAAQTALAAGCHPVIVVLGAHESAIRPVLADLDVKIVVNERWEAGMGTSIQTGLHELGQASVSGAILSLADQPFVTSDYLRRLMEKHAETGSAIIASRYSGTVGVPVYFARSAFPSLMNLKPQEGCKGVILRAAESAGLVDCPEAEIDIDTPEDYARSRNK